MTVLIHPEIRDAIDREIESRFLPVYDAIERRDPEAVADALIDCRPGTPSSCDCRHDKQIQELDRERYWLLRHCFESQHCSIVWVEMHGLHGDDRLLRLTRRCLYMRMLTEEEAGNTAQAAYILELHDGLLALSQDKAIAWRKSLCSA